MSIRQLLLIAILGVGVGASGQTYRYEAETGVITSANSTNTRVASSVPGFSGTGYVTGFPNQDAVVDRLTVGASLPEGLYDLAIGYRSPFGGKGYELAVGGQSGSGMFPLSTAFDEITAGQYYFDGDPFDVTISEGWGYYDVDYFEFRSAELRLPLPTPTTLSTPNPSPNSQYLMRYLASQYGENTLFGHQRENGNPGAILSPGVLNHTGGIMPSVIGGDLMRYSPSRVERGDSGNGESERLIDWAQQTGGAVTMMWHWNAPSGLIDQPGQEWWRGFYTDSTTFDLGAALANPASNEYQLLIRDIDVISGELQKFKQAGVPVLWRPLHEAQGNDSGAWFWWGNSGPEALKELWGLMHDRMTNHHGLDNLIWVSTTQVEATDWQAWYPGDDLVDVIGVDVYSNADDNMSAQWTELLDEFDGEKMIALTETGSLPPEDVLERYGVAFSYMLPWSEGFLTDDQTPAEVQGIVGDTDVIDLSELPTTPWRVIDSPLSGDFDGDGDVDPDDLAVWRDHYGLQTSTPADANNDGRVDAADYTVWRDAYAQTSVAVPEPSAWLLALIGLSRLTRRGR
ncbi:Mannan endo-1,4-beta-mannosidase [Planctomycetes bacterium MalM25]|nr:Mannan endo-1,4-beta-mannosidase [Planctomycetes bacterium MalM25]